MRYRFPWWLVMDALPTGFAAAAGARRPASEAHRRGSSRGSPPRPALTRFNESLSGEFDKAH